MREHSGLINLLINFIGNEHRRKVLLKRDEPLWNNSTADVCKIGKVLFWKKKV